jgi:malonyl-CoA O-methyltransferase
MKPSASLSAPPSLDTNAAARWLARSHAQSPFLHEEVGQRMRERLQWIVKTPKAWADWSPVLGGVANHNAIRVQYPQSEVFCHMPSAKYHLLAIKKEAEKASPLAWAKQLFRTPAEKLDPLRHFGAPPDGAVDMVWANALLHQHPDPQTLMRQWHNALAVGGYVMFSAFGPDTLKNLRDLYAERGWGEPCHEFTDMHDFGDMLVQTGFAEPVMDVERITLTYATAEALIKDLRGLGRNMHIGRPPGLMGRRFGTALKGAVKNLAGADGLMSLEFEVIYGHAFKPQPRIQMNASSAISMKDMRSMLQSRTNPRTTP